ncbi:unnamed protein product [Prorocentrum cordatum]|uniref:Uncharacterized protein n=1 Tax=Prorocentrum cordatum TaxID=2364126 RepID=A0ABN9Y0R0_9DINO|nr:unnamed protein product [Polarella glacialis]
MGRVAGGSPKRRQAERRAGKRARGCLGRQRRTNRGGRRTRSRTARAEGAARGGPGAQGLPRGCAASARGAHRHQLAPRSSLASSPSLRGTSEGGGGREREEGEGENFAALTSSLGPPGLRGGSAPLPEEGGPSPARSSPQLRARSIPDNARKSAASMSLAGAASGLCRQPLGVKALAASALRLLVGIVEDKLGANLVAHKVHLRAYQEHDPALESTTTLTPSCVSTTSSNLLTLSV